MRPHRPAPPLPLLVAASLLVALPAQSTPTLRNGTPAEVGMDEHVLDAGVNLLRKAIAADSIKGAVVLVARRGVVVAHEAMGVRDVAGEVPMRTDTLFRLASNTKPLVATAVLQLVEQGRVRLDDFARLHLPSFDNHRAGQMTVRHLLSHTSGFRIEPIFFAPLLQQSDEHPDAPSLQAEVRRFGAVGAAVAPGTSYSYSNAGFNSLGALVERVSGQSLADYLDEHVYTPLGMDDACNHESVADRGRMSAVFSRRGDGAWRARWTPEDEPDYPFARASGGGIATAFDYAKFCQAMLQGGAYGEARILSSESVAEMTRRQTPASIAASYGLGWGVDADGSFEHTGSDGTMAWVDPAREIVGIVFTQSTGPGNPRAAFRRVVAAACLD